jgi:hypothetical protein
MHSIPCGCGLDVHLMHTHMPTSMHTRARSHVHTHVCTSTLTYMCCQRHKENVSRGEHSFGLFLVSTPERQYYCKAWPLSPVPCCLTERKNILACSVEPPSKQDIKMCADVSLRKMPFFRNYECPHPCVQVGGQGVGSHDTAKAECGSAEAGRVGREMTYSFPRGHEATSLWVHTWPLLSTLLQVFNAVSLKRDGCFLRRWPVSTTP